LAGRWHMIAASASVEMPIRSVFLSQCARHHCCTYAANNRYPHRHSRRFQSKHSFFVTAVEIYHGITIRDRVGGSKQFPPTVRCECAKQKAELLAK
jgi:hypothetical protein